MRGLPDGSAGLPRRGFAPSRNDNGGTGMGGGGASRFSGVSLYAVIASPAGRGNPVSSFSCHCEEGLEEN